MHFCWMWRLPLTSIFVSKLANIEVVGIDCHQECVDLGTQVLSRFFPKEKVSLQAVAGEHFDYSQADVVYVAAMVPNKAEVFHQIAKTNPAAFCITRGGAGLREVFYESVDMGALAGVGWSCVAVQPPIFPIRNTSYIFKHAGNA